jgi:hypothetical protein
MPDFPFPLNSTPGHLAGEGEGRLINAYPEKDGDKVYIRRVPGLVRLQSVAAATPRGMVDLNGDIYAAYSGAVIRRTAAGTVTTLTGSIPGTDGVTWARNNRTTGGAATPDLVGVREGGGAYTVSATAVAAYPDSDLPATVNSGTAHDGYLMFTNPDGRIFASNLNTTAQDALSFATAEAKPDGLKRGISHGGTFYAMGTDSIEPWNDIGASPFPLARVPSVIPVGLLTTMAVAGFEEGWNRFPIFVAHDGTVRELRGYDTAVISTPSVERFIAGSTISTLEASVFTARGHAFWALSSNIGTWVRDVREGSWTERLSPSLTRWRASRSVKSNGQWVFGDLLSLYLYAISDQVFTEDGNPLTWTIESGALKEYPVRASIPAVFADFTKAVATVALSWSHDGGATWSTPIARSLTEADKFAVRVNRLGLSTHHGTRLRLSSFDAAEFSFMGASVPKAQARAA